MLNVSKRRRWLLLSLLPIFVLGCDFALFQRIFERRQLLAALDATTLLQNKVIHLGTTHSISVNVALESLDDDDSLAYFSKSQHNGLVTSIFVDPHPRNGEQVFDGDLSRAVGRRLQSVSKSVHRRVLDFIGELGQQQAGDVRAIDLRLSESERTQFPVDRLIVVVLKRLDAKEDGTVLETALARVIADAEKAELNAVAFPSIGYQANKENSPSFNQIFGGLFKALKQTHRPLDLFISLYSNWRTADVEKAVAAVNVAWTTREGAGPGLLPSLYRGRYRVLLVLTTVCLLACMRRAQKTIKGFLLIIATYVGGALALAEFVERFTRNYPEQLVEILVIISWLGLALGFPGFIGWDIKQAFVKKRKSSSRRPGDPKVAENNAGSSMRRRRTVTKQARTQQEQTSSEKVHLKAGNERPTDDSSGIRSEP
jgi:hypothetical protein